MSMRVVWFLLLCAGATTLTAQVVVPPSAPPRAAADPFAASRNARGDGRHGMLLRQFRAVEPQHAARFEAGWRPACARYQDARDVPAGHWVWAAPYWFVFRDGPGTTATNRAFGPEQACGAPNTAAPGDRPTAWATDREDARDEWLLVEFAGPLRAMALEVHETFKPGALAAVSVFTPAGEEIEVWRNRTPQPTREPNRVLRIDLPVGFLTERVRLQLASEAVPGWNEIDDVGVRDEKGVTHWATRAEASSTFAARAGAAPAGVALAPAGGAPAGGVDAEVGQLVLEMGRLEALPRAAGGVTIELPRVGVAPAPGALGAILRDDAAKAGAAAAAQQARITALEARVAALEAELARLRAATSRPAK